MPATKKKKAKGKPSSKSPKSRTRSPTPTQPPTVANPDEKRQWIATSPPSLFAAVALGGAALAAGWTRFVPQTNDIVDVVVNGGGSGDVGGEPHHEEGDPLLSSEDLLKRVRKSDSFELLLADNGTRTLTATTDIPSDTILMEIPRELMVWDLDAARNEFVRKYLFDSPLFEGNVASGDVMSKRAALLAAYLALLRKGVVVPERKETTTATDATTTTTATTTKTVYPLHTSVANAMPSYTEYASFHPILADPKLTRKYLGKKSVAYAHLVHVRESLRREYDMLGTAFATRISREEYLACRLAVQSRSFQLTDAVPADELSTEERELYQRTLGIDFERAVVSIEPVNDWMNTHANNNVRVGGYDAARGTGLAWTTRPIPRGGELINNYGTFYDHVLFGQYGFVPADGTGTSVASMFVHHDIDLLGDLVGETDPTVRLPTPEEMAPYLMYDYGYDECVTREGNPDAFELKRLKLEYLRLIAVDPSRWVLPLPPRTSTDATPFSTTAAPDPSDYRVPSFGPEIYQYLEENALSASLPCRLIALADVDLEGRTDVLASLKEDLWMLQRSSSTPHGTPVLRLEELEISISWFARTLQCMARLTSPRKGKDAAAAWSPSVREQEIYILNLVEAGDANTLEWNAAHVRLEEMQSQAALEDWARDVLDKVKDIDGVSPNDVFVRDVPCPEEYTAELFS